MAFLENLTKKVGEAAQAAAKKSGELVEITKINMNISAEEDKIQKLYVQIGKKVYENFCSNTDIYTDFKEECEQIVGNEDNIKSLKQKIMEVKNIKLCSGCGAELERTAIFCAKCGFRQEEIKPAAEQAPAAQLCPSCKAPIQPGTAFCTSCGAKVE